MHVALVDLNEARLQEASTKLKAINANVQVLCCPTDVTSEEGMMQLQKHIWQELGGCHFLFNNAGIGGGGGPYTNVSRWRTVMEINLFGVLNGHAAFVKPMLVGLLFAFAEKSKLY